MNFAPLFVRFPALLVPPLVFAWPLPVACQNSVVFCRVVRRLCWIAPDRPIALRPLPGVVFWSSRGNRTDPGRLRPVLRSPGDGRQACA